VLSIVQDDDGRVLRIGIKGHLERDEHEALLSEVRDQIDRHGMIRVLVDLSGRRGPEVDTLWEDAKFDLSHLAGVQRLALVEEEEWEAWMGEGPRPFLSPKVGLFRATERQRALAWLKKDALSC
jgi:hypothetical protein